MSSQRRRLRRTALLLPALAAALALGGCAGSASNDSAATAGDAPIPASDVKGVDQGAADSSLSEVAPGADSFQAATASGGKAQQSPTDYAQQAVISTGAVSLSSDDVAKARFDVQTVIDDHRGETSDEKTETGDDGKVTRARLVFRVPVSEFSDTMTALEGSAKLLSSSRSSEDVTTQVIDTEVRIRAQEKSIERIEVLYARAQSIRDIMAIEAQLNRRQADLDSLKQQQAWLQSQTSMSTITVNLQVTPEKKAAAKDKDGTGFLAGLSAGWHGLTKVTAGALTALGAFLPFGVVILVLGLPLWVVVRRLTAARRGTPASDPSPAES